MTDHSTSVRLVGVEKRYAGRRVLDAVDLDVNGGELVALLGPSGCGKTTALRIIAGFERPDGGAVRIGDLDVTNVRASRRGVGLVFQAYSLFPHMTASENVAYGLGLRGTGRRGRAARAAELLGMVGLEEHGEKYPHQLSGGQQQRVALVRALAIEPRVLLLDEPLSALDAQVRQRLREEIRRIQRDSGTTTVIVTHDQEEALTMADRVAVMRDGRIDQIGTPDEVYGNPATPFVSSFVGVVNRVPAVMRDDWTVSAFGRDVLVTNGSDHLPGSFVTALVRPEAIHLERGGGDAEVIGSTLRGAMSSVALRMPGSTDLVRVDLPSAEARRFTLGERVTVTCTARSVVVDDADRRTPGPTGAAA
ncbi:MULTISPECIES: ABC transporter ATP-binding protein [unclassified Curtobacterium]|uniref:ABC transporter ATP-binding protein n=1 Tax=unclassified Curtobacterium TaxID=257496 RepID=UPI0021AD304B|nr:MULTISPECIES: ABC transporter ATP-binding protein [unclassified Curtobacterium]WIE79211.1 ABC transporter ATP-binding protein [Curtobacterium sp. MCSS17_016]